MNSARGVGLNKKKKKKKMPDVDALDVIQTVPRCHRQLKF